MSKASGMGRDLLLEARGQRGEVVEGRGGGAIDQSTVQYNTTQYNTSLMIPYGKLLVYLLAGNIIHAYLHKTSNNIIMYRVIAHVHQLVKT